MLVTKFYYKKKKYKIKMNGATRHALGMQVSFVQEAGSLA